MYTEAGVKLKKKEINLINALKRLEKRWEKDGKDLWLFSASSTLYVMMYGGTKRNPEPDYKKESVNPNNAITSIKIPNDGGDW